MKIKLKIYVPTRKTHGLDNNFSSFYINTFIDHLGKQEEIWIDDLRKSL